MIKKSTTIQYVTPQRKMITSIVFKRSATTPSAPTGGSYDSPVPDGWSDGIPDGSAAVYMSSRVFTFDGKPPQQNAWSTPAMISSSIDIEYQFSSVANDPGNPTITPDYWSTSPSPQTIWMAVRKCVDNVWSSWQVIRIKGETGQTGPIGATISSIVAYFKLSSLIIGETLPSSGDTGWSDSMLTPTPDSPYLWRYLKTTMTNGTVMRSTPENIARYSTGVNPNLILCTDFESLTAWTKKSVYSSKASYSASDGVSGHPAITHLIAGVQGHKAYYDSTNGWTSTQINYKEVLFQAFHTPTKPVLESGKWYTLSFYGSGTFRSYIYSSVSGSPFIDIGAGCYKDNVFETVLSDGSILWSGSKMQLHTFTFKTVSSLPSANAQLLFRLFPLSSGSNTITVSMIKLEQSLFCTGYSIATSETHGTVGPTGPRARCSKWVSGRTYYSGASEEVYEDWAWYNGQYYNCIRTIVNSTVNPYQSVSQNQGIWKVDTQFLFVATGVAFVGDEGNGWIIDGGIIYHSSGNIILDSNGHIDAGQGNFHITPSGSITAKIGIFAGYLQTKFIKSLDIANEQLGDYCNVDLTGTAIKTHDLILPAPSEALSGRIVKLMFSPVYSSMDSCGKVFCRSKSSPVNDLVIPEQNNSSLNRKNKIEITKGGYVELICCEYYHNWCWVATTYILYGDN